MSDLHLAFQRTAYYTKNFFFDTVPHVVFRRRLLGLLKTLGTQREFLVQDRLDYYNKIDEFFDVSANATTISRIPLKQSFYYYDLKEYARYFRPQFRLDYLFGDITFVPPAPALVKSRPISGNNRNSVLLKLNKLRHFRKIPDSVPFSNKKPMAVWRGGANHPRRTLFVENCIGKAFCDVGFSDGATPELRRPYVSPAGQMNYRYIISIEGNDVATNLKWIMASQSLCFMPAPSCETWFMEGRLEPGIHYVQVKPDGSDIEEKIDHYESAPQEAAAIIANANAYVEGFACQEVEQLVSLLVLYKYFVLSGQMEPDPDVQLRFDLGRKAAHPVEYSVKDELLVGN